MKKGLLGSIFTFGSFTLVSRVLGLVRDVVIGAVFGPGVATDAFLVAFKIPNFMRRLFAEGAFSQAFVPVLSEYKTKREPHEVRRLVAQTTGALGSVLLLLSVIGVLAAPWLVMLFAPGFLADPVKYALAVDMLRYTFPYILFISLAACAGGALNAYGRFGPPAFAPVLLNIALIAAAVWLAPRLDVPIMALAFGVFVAGVLQWLVQLPYLGKERLLALPGWGWRDPGVRRILRLMGPTIFGSSVAQINMLVGTVLASFLVTGSVSWLYFADRLVEFPLGILGVGLGTIILPRLSGEHVSGEAERFSATLDWALRWLVLIVAPSTVGLVMLSVPLIATLFHYGAFRELDVLASALALSVSAVGLGGFMLVKIAAPGYFARQDTKTPVKIAVASVLVNMALSIAAVLWLRESPIGFVGLAFATAVAAVLNGSLLLLGLRRLGVYRPAAGWSPFLRRVAAATLAMAGALYYPAAHTGFWLEADGWLRAGALGVVVVAAVALYFGLLHLMGQSWRVLTSP